MVVTNWSLVHMEHGYRILRNKETGEHVIKDHRKTEDGIIERGFQTLRAARAALDGLLGVESETLDHS